MPTFTPPTYERVIAVRRQAPFKLTESQSVVRVNGAFVTVKTPSHEQLVAAGVEGVDFFIGGNEYQISTTTADELTAAGYDVQG